MTDLKLVDVRLAVSDSPVSNLPIKIHCREPKHNDKEMSMAVYADGLCCFGCGKRISRRMEALAYLLYGDEHRWRDAIKVADKYTFQSLDNYRKRVGEQARMDPLPKTLAATYHANLYGSRKNRLKWLYRRFLNDSTLDRFCLGHDGTRFTIPIFDKDSNLVSIRFRRDDLYGTEAFDGKPIPKYSGLTGRNGQYLYPEWLIERIGSDTLFLYEGELDTVLSWQLGFPGITVTNGAGQFHKLPKLIKENFPFVKNIVIVGDQDEPGQAAVSLAYDEACDAGFNPGCTGWNLDKGKDITEFCQLGYDFKEYVKEILT